MARITGKDLYVTFAGTDISGEFRSFEVTGDQNLVDITAGDDSVAGYAATYTDRKATYSGLHDAASGSTIWAAVAEGTSGTLLWGPQGTASGKPKYYATAIVATRGESYPYNDAIELSLDFQFTTTITSTAF